MNNSINYMDGVRCVRSSGLAVSGYDGLIRCKDGKTGLALHPDTVEGSGDYWCQILLTGWVAFQVDRSDKVTEVSFTLEYKGDRNPTIKPLRPELLLAHEIKSRSQKK